MVRLADVLVREGVPLLHALEAITRSAKQVALVVDDEGRLRGLLTDGDVRRAILRGVSLESKIDEVMNHAPSVAQAGVSATDAVALMRARRIRHLPVLDPRGVVVDLLVLEELLVPAPPLPTPAVIMAGGEGRRLRPLTEATPKPLLTVGGKPLLEILIERLRLAGVTRVLLAVQYKSALIRERMGDGRRLGVTLEYVEEPEPLGTMGALRLLRDGLRLPFFVVNGDILTKCDFRAMWEFHLAQGSPAMTVGVSVHQIDIPYGEFTLHADRITRVEEKPRKEYPINAGIYLVDPSVIELVPAGRYLDATDLIRVLLDRGREVAAYLVREYWLDVGRPPDLEKANRDVAEGLFE